MRKQQTIACIIFFLIVGLFTYNQKLSAQVSKVDSIFLLLQQSRLTKELDTAKFSQAIQLLSATDLTSKELQRLESAFLQFKGNHKAYVELIKYSILVGNKYKDYLKSIEFGKKLVAEWTQSKDTDLMLLSKLALVNMRLFYRNSGNVVDGVKYYLQKLQEFKQTKDKRGIESCYYVLGAFIVIWDL